MRLIGVAIALVLSLAFLPGADAGAPLTLPECISRALATIPRLAQAGAAVDLSAAQRREAEASLFPSLQAQAQYLQEPGYREVITNRGLSAEQLIADYLVYDGGRRTARVYAARYTEEADRMGFAAARTQVVFDTSVAFYGLVHAWQIVAELQSSIERLTRYTAVVRSLRATGRSTENDVLRIEVMRRDSQLQLNSARHNRARASFALGALIGDYGRDDITVAENPAPKSSIGTIDNNPSLRALERRRAGATQDLQAARAERYPTLKMELTSGFLGTDFSSTFTRHAGASYGGVLSLPLFDGGAIRARIDQAQARLHQADALLAQARIDLSEQVAEARSRYDEARQSVEILQKSLPTAEASFQLSWARFLGGGNITLLEVIDSYNQLLNTRLGMVDQELACNQAATAIEQLIGTAFQ